MMEVEHRPSDSPHIARVWRAHTAGVATMTSVAVASWELVVWEEDGRRRVAIRGPETVATTADVPDGSTAFGISFAHGTSLADLPMGRLVDTMLESPQVSKDGFVLQRVRRPLPGYEDAEDVVDRLVRDGVLRHDPLVAEALTGQEVGVGARSVQRRVTAATGLTQGAIRQIERARQAAISLGEGNAPLAVAHRLGYYDQPHLARSLKRFIGRTATQLRDDRGDDRPLSLLYKTGEPPRS